MQATETPRPASVATEPTTAEVIAAMLTENTGVHFLDSGFNNGRNWQRNAGHTVESFQANPPATVDFRYGIEVTLDVFHFLNSSLEYSPEVDGVFQAWSNSEERAGEHDFTDAQEFPTYYCELIGDGEPCGLYNEGDPVTVNTYNGESLLSQVLQYVFFSCDHGDFVVLQIHGGADVRGGYTRPRLFSTKSMDETAIFDNARSTIVCGHPDAPHNWTTDDAYHWYEDGSTAGTQLQEYPRLTLEEIRKKVPAIAELEEVISKGERQLEIMQAQQPHNAERLQAQHSSSVATIREEIEALTKANTPPETLLIDDDGRGFCPKCGHELKAAPY